MENYLTEIEFAATSTLAAIWHEHAELENINAEKSRLFRVNWNKYPGIQPINDDVAPIPVRIAGGPPNIFYSLEEKELYQRDDEAKILEQRIYTRQFSVNSLSGTLLQFAKQGMSIVHGELESCPDGRLIGSQALKLIIWRGRNQSLHWAELVHQKEQDCFRQLVRDFGKSFAEFNTKNLGFEVIKLLGWKTFAEFKRDMLTIQ